MEKGKEYEVKIIERDPSKKYIIVKINGEEVKIEKLSEEEIEKLEKILDKGHELLIEKIKEVKVPEFPLYYASCASARMAYYFGNERYYLELNFPYYGHFLKYKGNYLFLDMDIERLPTIYWVLLVPVEIYNKYYGKDEEAKKIRERYAPPKDICDEFSAIIEHIAFPKYKIEVIGADRDRKYIIVKINGEEVEVRRLANEEKKEIDELIKKKKYVPLEIEFAGNEILFKEKDFSKEKALAVYRLMLYFGIPDFITWSTSFAYYLKYKGETFLILDEHLTHIKICLCYWIPNEVYEKYHYGKDEEAKKIRERYAPPKDICDEFSAIIEYLVRNPYMIHTLYGDMLI
ncbi:MAG: hypothetical protein QXW69_03010 [Nitrososphaerota archaeon]